MSGLGNFCGFGSWLDGFLRRKSVDCGAVKISTSKTGGFTAAFTEIAQIVAANLGTLGDFNFFY